MTKILLAFVLVLSLVPVTARAQDAASTAPNVLFLLADDLGWMDVGFQNPETFYETPNLDRLAASGMRFTQAYAACPVCSPTRASIRRAAIPLA